MQPAPAAATTSSRNQNSLQVCTMRYNSNDFGNDKPKVNNEKLSEEMLLHQNQIELSKSIRILRLKSKSWHLIGFNRANETVN